MWQSFVAGIQTSKRGYIWRIGNGESVNIWMGPWAPSRPSRMVIARRGHQLLTNVSELINPINGGWDEKLVTAMFGFIDCT